MLYILWGWGARKDGRGEDVIKKKKKKVDGVVGRGNTRKDTRSRDQGGKSGPQKEQGEK